MSLAFDDLVLPRPGATSGSVAASIPGPCEEAFTAAFGKLLPPVNFINTTIGKAAFYEILPATESSISGPATQPDRVLFIHGVQTPALGMLPLVRALHSTFPHAHFALVDLWGHGLSDTPIVVHEASLFHQLLDTLLNHLKWPAVHLVGFSFGGALTAGFVASHSSRVQTYTLVAPAGLLCSADFTEEERGHLRGGGDEAAARKWVLSFLEGGELVVPLDWKARVAKGQVVAEAVRDWQMRNHPGHTASVIAVFRDGGVMDNEVAFRGAQSTKIPSLAILGGLDTLCRAAQLHQLGFNDIKVVADAGHGVVRDRVPEVADHISKFWKECSRNGGG